MMHSPAGRNLGFRLFENRQTKGHQRRRPPPADGSAAECCQRPRLPVPHGVPHLARLESLQALVAPRAKNEHAGSPRAMSGGRSLQIAVGHCRDAARLPTFAVINRRVVRVPVRSYCATEEYGAERRHNAMKPARMEVILAHHRVGHLGAIDYRER